MTVPVPQITPLPEPPTTQDIENFDERADEFLPAVARAAAEMNAVVHFVNDAAMDVSSMEEVRDAAYAARDETQQIKSAAEQSLTQIGDQKIVELTNVADGKITIMSGLKDEAEQSAISAAASAAAAGQAAGLPEFLDGVAGKPLVHMPDGSGAQFYAGYTPFITVISTTNLVAGERYRVNTRLQAFNLILPADPHLGATIYLFDAEGTWHINSPTLVRNGKTIMGLAEDCHLNMRNASAKLVFDGIGWRVIA